MQYESVERWLGRLSAGDSRKVHRFHLERWLKWMDEKGNQIGSLNPDELVDYQKLNRDYAILDLLQRYIQEMEGRTSYLVKAHTSVRSFFLHNRAELPRDRAFRIQGDIPPVMGDLTVEEIRNIILASNECYSAVWLCMVQSGMGSAELIYWSNFGWSKLRKELREDPKIIRIDLPGRKKARYSKKYYTFIGPDGIEALRRWVETRPKEGKTIFTTMRGTPLGYWPIHSYWMKRLFRLGIVERVYGQGQSTRYGKNVHECRDVFRTLWQKTGAASEVAEYLMGHEVDPLQYNKFYRDVDYTLGEYEKALPHLSIMSRPEAYSLTDARSVRKLEVKLQDMEDKYENIIEMLARYDEQRKRDGRDG